MDLYRHPATNRLQVGRMAYDANGNITQMPNTGTMVYDGRNRMVSLNAVPVAYDPDNRRVFHVESGPVVDFWLPNGERLMTLCVVDEVSGRRLFRRPSVVLLERTQQSADGL